MIVYKKRTNNSKQVQAYIFFFKNISWSTCSGSKTLLCVVTMSPAVLNTLSAGTLVAGIQRYLLAMVDNNGSSSSWALHQFIALSVRARAGLRLYLVTSSLALSSFEASFFGVKVSPNRASMAFFFAGGDFEEAINKTELN